MHSMNKARHAAPAAPLRRRLRKPVLILGTLGLFVSLTAESCDGTASDEADKRSAAYTSLVERQPQASMDYSSTRETINGWVKTWGKPNKLAYVYLFSDSQPPGYYVLKGLPVSYCASLTRPQDDLGNGAVVSAPGVDGVYYSGGQCSVYYGFDATTGAYMEFSIGNGLNYELFDQPLTPDQLRARGGQQAVPLGPTVLPS